MGNLGWVLQGILPSAAEEIASPRGGGVRCRTWAPFLARQVSRGVAAGHAACSPFQSQEASTSDAACRDALRSIPLDKLSSEDRAKFNSVLDNVSVFRRLPTKVIDCDPTMYLFLVRHPDVVVNIWELFKISRLQFRQTGENQFRVVEPLGTTASVEFIYRSHDTHVIYGEGDYEGPLLARPVRSRGVLVLKTRLCSRT